jgi:hypothetical protein
MWSQREKTGLETMNKALSRPSPKGKATNTQPLLMSKEPHLSSPRKGTTHPLLFEYSTFIAGFLKMPSRDYIVDVVVMKLGFVIQHRSFPKGEREGEWGRVVL